MSIPTPPAPAMTPKVRAFLYGTLGWLGVLAFLVFLGYAAAPETEIPTWLGIVNAVLNGANLVFFVAKDNTPGQGHRP
jgi:cobalamin biosynthesis protein CobD/CbiB